MSAGVGSDVDVVVVFVTAPDDAVAERVAHALLDDRLVACANVVGGVTSHYRWEGKLERASEVLMILKCRANDVDAVAARVKATHPYAVPEVLALPVVQGLPAYLKWVVDETTR